MTVRADVSERAVPHDAPAHDAVYVEGLVAGAVGAATIAAWFLLLDTIAGRPFYTPSVLGTALVRGGAAVARPDAVPVDVEMVVTFTWIHLMAFLLIGLAASKLLQAAERDADLGFGILLLFVVFEFGFIAVFSALAGEVLQAIAWPAIVAGNLLAASAMAWTFWRRRRGRLVIRP